MSNANAEYLNELHFVRQQQQLGFPSFTKKLKAITQFLTCLKNERGVSCWFTISHLTETGVLRDPDVLTATQINC